MTTLSEELAELAALHADGHLTDAEYTAAKASAITRYADQPDDDETPPHNISLSLDGDLAKAAHRHVDQEYISTIIGVVLILVFICCGVAQHLR